MIEDVNRTETTPEISYDAENHTLTLQGESYPEDVTKFYGPLLTRIKSVLKAHNRLRIVLKLEYFNTSSAKYLFDIFSLLESANKENAEVSVDWHYHEDVEVMQEQGEDFADEFEIPFNLINDL